MTTPSPAAPSGPFSLAVGNASARGFFSVAIGDGCVAEEDFGVKFSRPFTVNLDAKNVREALVNLQWFVDMHRVINNQQAVEAIQEVQREIIGCMHRAIQEDRKKTTTFTQAEYEVTKEKIKCEELD